MRLQILDLETMLECFLCGIYDFENDRYFEFEISKRKNQLSDFIKWYYSDDIDRSITFNGVGFDLPIIQYILDNYKRWYDLSALQITQMISDYASKTIDDNRHGIVNYRENQFYKPTYDLFTIHGLDNMARSSSLKKIEFNLQLPFVEEMPVHHLKKDLTDEEIDLTIDYCRKDLFATHKLYLLTIGETENTLYQDNNMIELRHNTKEEFGIDCLNYSDIKLGEEIIKNEYAKETNQKIYELPKKGFFRKSIKLKECIPSYIKFQTPQLKELLKTVKNRVVSQTETIDYAFEFYGTTYDLKSGGLHSRNINESYTNKNKLIYTSDVGSYYPASKHERGIYAFHLGKPIMTVYSKLYLRRIDLKPLAKKDKKIKGIVGSLKLSLNVVFGKEGSMDSWMFDKKALLSVTIGNEFTLLMLIEDLELNGYHVISANTDGIEVLIDKDKEEGYLAICKKWEDITKYSLEHDQYEWINYSTINDYIAKTVSGEYKYKGDFMSDFELHKNSSHRIIPLAVKEFFKNGTSPEEFIKKHTNIYDFCIMAKVRNPFYIAEVNGDKEIIHKKLVRYFVSNTGSQLFKRGQNKNEKEVNNHVNAPMDYIGNIYVTYFNNYYESEDYNINYNWYIYKALKLISSVMKTRHLEDFIDKTFKKKLTLWD